MADEGNVPDESASAEPDDLVQQLAGLRAKVKELERDADRKTETYKEAIQQLRQHIHDLERSNAGLQDFAHVASHDLREPLRVVALNSDFLARSASGRLGPEVDEAVRAIFGAEVRMRALIDGLLAYSRLDKNPVPFEQVDCGSACAQAVSNLAAVIQETQTSIVRDDLPSLPGDERQLVQLFQNMVANAIKFRSARPPEVRVSAEFREDEWEFVVSDNGIGFEPKDAARIFRICEGLHHQQNYAGAGVGLAICKKIVERHGGRIWADSVPGEGSRFFFTLPEESDASVSGYHYVKRPARKTREGDEEPPPKDEQD